MNEIESKTDIAIIGSGILGLAHAYIAAKSGLKVAVFERNEYPVGASIRNFGLIWPIGQRPGENHERALRSRSRWLEVIEEASIWSQLNGSLHLAYHNDEADVLDEFHHAVGKENYETELFSINQLHKFGVHINTDGLKSALWSKMEMTVNPRKVLKQIITLLQEKYNVSFHFSTAINQISDNQLFQNNRSWKAEKIIICSGIDFETLFPDHYKTASLTKVKLQMMKAANLSNQWQLGPTLCAGLTLLHYDSFKDCNSVSLLKKRVNSEMPWANADGIHVLLGQNDEGDLIIGDSHQYGLTHDPFIKETINHKIINYLQSFFVAGTLNITERWTGYYSKLVESNNTYLAIHPTAYVTIVNGVGGAGMTLSFGIAEESIEQLIALK